MQTHAGPAMLSRPLRPQESAHVSLDGLVFAGVLHVLWLLHFLLLLLQGSPGPEGRDLYISSLKYKFFLSTCLLPSPPSRQFCIPIPKPPSFWWWYKRQACMALPARGLTCSADICLNAFDTEQKHCSTEDNTMQHSALWLSSLIKHQL